MRVFFADIPIHLEEAARVDGETMFGALRHVVAPQAAPTMPLLRFALLVQRNLIRGLTAGAIKA